MPERDELDLLIDSALRNYAEPRPGLDRRVLARVSGNTTRSPWRKWVLAAIAVPVLAGVILLGYLVPWNRHAQPSRVATAPAVAPVITPPAPHEALIPVSNRVRPRDHIAGGTPAVAAARPKLDVFPTPEPLSAQEQALTRFVAHSSETDQKALLADQEHIAEPLQITAIRIPLLRSPEENQK